MFALIGLALWCRSLREKESDEPKPLTVKLFGLTQTGPVEDDKE